VSAERTPIRFGDLVQVIDPATMVAWRGIVTFLDAHADHWSIHVTTDEGDVVIVKTNSTFSGVEFVREAEGDEISRVVRLLMWRHEKGTAKAPAR